MIFALICLTLNGENLFYGSLFEIGFGLNKYSEFSYLKCGLVFERFFNICF